MRLRIATFLLVATRSVSFQYPIHYTGNAFRSYRRLKVRCFASSSSAHDGKTTTTFWRSRSRDECWRPDVNDVERISYGKPAKKKRTGSRGVPHRLNQDERLLFDLARRKGFLEVAGSAWRSQRREAPLLNTYRSLCDARGQVNIVLHKGNTGLDTVVVDLSPLRHPEDFKSIAEACLERINLPSASITDYEMISGIVKEDTGGGDEKDADDEKEEMIVDDAFETKPIYQCPPFQISWELARSDAKTLGKELASIFQTAEPNVGGKNTSKKRKYAGVKPGKNRRSGGYGIG